MVHSNRCDGGVKATYHPRTFPKNVHAGSGTRTQSWFTSATNGLHIAGSQGGHGSGVVCFPAGTGLGIARARVCVAGRGRPSGRALEAGAHFPLVVLETMAALDARYTLELDFCARIFVQNHALRRGSAESIANLVRGAPADPVEIYFRCVLTFEVSVPALAWLTESSLIGTGALPRSG